MSSTAAEITEEVIDTLVASQNYQRPIGGWSDGKEPTFTATISLLVKLIDRIAPRVATVIEKRLEIDHKWSRANACRVVQELSKLRADFGLRVLPNVIRSLELADDIYEGVSADGSAVDAVSELLVLKWAQAEEILWREMPRLSIEAQAVLVGAYERIFGRGENWRHETTAGLDDSIVAGAVTRCLDLLNDASQEPVIRRTAAEAFRSAFRANALPALESFEQLLGCLAIVLESDHPPASRQRIIVPGSEELQAQEEVLRQQDRHMEWDRLKQELTEVIEKFGERDPLEIGRALIATIDSATSADRQPLRRTALGLLGRIASRQPELPPIALPSFMSCLMDYSSAAVRAVAIRAITDAFRHNHLTVPSNVVDVILLHLRDGYVVVHQAAVHAFRFWHIPLSESQHREAFASLFNLWKVYAEDLNELFFMDDLADALLLVAGGDTEMRHVTLSLICDYLPTSQVLLDSKLCEELIRNTENDASISGKVAQTLIGCLAKHNRDRYRQRRDWREDTADWLCSLSSRVWQLTSTEFVTCAKNAVQRDPGEALLFAAVLCEHGQHTQEAEILSTAAESAKGHSLFHGLHEPFLQLQRCALAARGGAIR